MTTTVPTNLNIASYLGPDGLRTAVMNEDGTFVDTAEAAKELAGSAVGLRPYASVCSLQGILDAELDLDVLETLRTVKLDSLPPACSVHGSVELASPIPRPTKVIAVGLNSNGLAGGPVPLVDEMPSAAPFWFTKAPSSVIGHLQPVIHPGSSHTDRLIPEPELAMIIGRRCGPGLTSPTAEKASAFIAGWTICNDMSALDIEFDRGGAPFAYNLTWSKSYPTFAPVGPWLTRLTPEQVLQTSISLRVNDDLICHYRVSDLIWTPFELLEYFAAVVVLEPGDIISCGNVPPVKIVQPGDVIDIEAEGIGHLRNPVVAAERETSYRVPERARQFALDYLDMRHALQIPSGGHERVGQP